MEMQCPKGDFTASGNTEEEVRQQLEEHARTAHNMDQGSIDKMFGEMKEKVTGFLK
jgi:predicted small metal-binding protein